MQKAAIVIGVNKTGDLPVLNAAVAGATEVAEWLRREGFQVKRFLDTRRPVISSDLYGTIDKLVDQGTLEQLVIYFSGHGFLNNGSEHWMLSHAPDNPNEAVSLAESTELARQSGIPSVVFISDACRSVPQTLRADRVRGSLIFPNEGATAAVDVEVDRFFAALPGDPALELPLAESAGQYEGIYTTCLLDAFRHPDEGMIRTLPVDGATVRVVPNRNLKAFLAREVNRVAQARSIKLRQLPQSIVESGESVYLGRVAARRGGGTRGPEQPRCEPVASLSDVARFELGQAMTRGAGGESFGTPAIAERGASSGFDASVDLLARTDAPTHFETETGVSVSGAQVASALGVNIGAELLTPGGVSWTALVRLHPGPHQVGSLILRFADGSGTVLAAVKGYIASLVVDGGRVVNIGYVPSQNSWRWSDYQQQRLRLERLRAIVAASARLGVFNVERDKANAVADEIRYMKSIDPTLGLYAAYAYADAGLRNYVRSVQGFMRDDLNADLFDVAMLAGTLTGSQHGPPVVPFCPMLGQGWGLLRVRGVKLSAALSRAADHLRPALWTTFEPAGMDIIEEAFHKGELT